MHVWDPQLTDKQIYDIQQVIATFALEEMYVTESDIKNMEDIALGRKTADQLMEEMRAEMDRENSCK